MNNSVITEPTSNRLVVQGERTPTVMESAMPRTNITIRPSRARPHRWKECSIVIIMQRVHEDDVTGRY
jgi:hypothetical protein